MASKATKQLGGRGSFAAAHGVKPCFRFCLAQRRRGAEKSFSATKDAKKRFLDRIYGIYRIKTKSSVNLVNPVKINLVFLAQRRGGAEKSFFSHKGRKGNKGWDWGMHNACRLSLVARRLSPTVAKFFSRRDAEKSVLATKGTKKRFFDRIYGIYRIKTKSCQSC